MEQLQSDQMMVEVIFSLDKMQFEVYGINSLSNIKSLMMIQTVDEIKEQLKSLLISTISVLQSQQSDKFQPMEPEVDEGKVIPELLDLLKNKAPWDK